VRSIAPPNDRKLSAIRSWNALVTGVPSRQIRQAMFGYVFTLLWILQMAGNRFQLQHKER